MMKGSLRVSAAVCLIVILAHISVLPPLEARSVTSLYQAKTYSQDCIRVIVYTYVTGLHKMVIIPNNLSDCVYIDYLRIDGLTVKLNRSACGGALVIDERYEPYLFPRGPGVIVISYSVRHRAATLCNGVLRVEISQPSTVTMFSSSTPGISGAPDTRWHSASEGWVEPARERVTGPLGVWMLVLLAAAWALAALVRACGV